MNPNFVSGPNGAAFQHTLHPSAMRAYFAAHAPITMTDAESTLIRDYGQDDPPTSTEIFDRLVAMRVEYADRMMAEMVIIGGR